VPYYLIHQKGMIAGLLLRNFKSYKGVNFIPFLKQDIEHLNIFIGNNGTGKSSILEALNAYFNDGKWIPTTSQPGVYVAPLFLLEKKKYSKFFTSETKALIEKISAFYWNFASNGNAIYDSVQEFLVFKDGIKQTYQQTHYLLLLGKNHADRKNLSFATFDSEIRKELDLKPNKDGELNKNDQKILNKIIQELSEIITFIYVPAETDISQFLKLNSEGMQDLVNKNIKDEIDSILTKEYSLSNGQANKNIVELINDELLPHVESIQKTIKTIDPAYRFNAGVGATKKLSSKDLIAPIIQAFYSKRRLEKNNKPIDDWSSGERKKALVDIVFSFLSQPDTVQEKDIIFAIDEPESSLDTGNKYDSFDRIEKISNSYFHQTFITTHWYGLLPIIQKGLIHCLELPGPDDLKPVMINYYDAKNFISERRKVTDDNYFKSFGDLASSIVSSIRAKEINWIIVEGADDRNYLDYYLKNLIEGYKDKFRILSVGGKGEVKLLYEHLFIPIKHTNETLLGKVLCIVDTDEQVLKLETEFQPISLTNLFFQRFQTIKDGISLLNIPNVQHTQKTTVEDTLEARKFYQSLKIVIENSGDADVKRAFENYKFYEHVKHSRIDVDKCILSPAPKGTDDIIQDKEIIKNFINQLENKWKISCVYKDQPFVKSEVPEWIEEYLLKPFYKKGDIPYIKEKETEKNVVPKITPVVVTEEVKEEAKAAIKEEVKEEVKEEKQEKIIDEEKILVEDTPPSNAPLKDIRQSVLKAVDETREDLHPPPSQDL